MSKIGKNIFVAFVVVVLGLAFGMLLVSSSAVIIIKP